MLFSPKEVGFKIGKGDVLFPNPQDFLRTEYHHCYHHCQCGSSYSVVIVIIGHSHFELFFDGLVKRLQFGRASIWDDRQAGVALVGRFIFSFQIYGKGQ